jgi:hypothetical protein
VWRAAADANPGAGMTVEALTDRDGKQANTSLEKEEMLRCESYPPNDGDQYYELPPADRHTRASLSKQLSKLYFLSQSRMHWVQTSCLLALYGCSGSGTWREL